MTVVESFPGAAQDLLRISHQERDLDTVETLGLQGCSLEDYSFSVSWRGELQIS